MFKSKFDSWLQRYFYAPRYLEILISAILSPFALIYSALIYAKFLVSKPQNFGLPIISVGNLVLGGTGKTPLTKAIFNEFSPKLCTFIALRGYKRSSKGLVKVAINGKILCDVNESGDEAMEYATTLNNANIIVCESRKVAINEAKNCGAKLVILDDGFGKFDILKFNILLRPKQEPALKITLPSGAYRYPVSFYKLANFIPQNDDILSVWHISNRTKKMFLVTAIANPLRLEDVFSECVGVKFFPDHYKFSKEELEKILNEQNADSLLVTRKDFVKISSFNLNISILELTTEISPNFRQKLANFIENFDTITPKN